MVVRLQLLDVGHDGALGVQVVLAASITVADYLLSTRIPPPLLELLDPVQDLGVGVGLEVLVVPAGVPGVAGVEPDGPQPAVRDHGARLGHVVPHHLITGSLVEVREGCLA